MPAAQLVGGGRCRCTGCGREARPVGGRLTAARPGTDPVPPPAARPAAPGEAAADLVRPGAA